MHDNNKFVITIVLVACCIGHFNAYYYEKFYYPPHKLNSLCCNLNYPEDTTVLSFSYNNIKRVPSYAFEGLDLVRTIQLNRNQISEIDSHAFDGMLAPRELYLSSNLITSETLSTPDIFAGMRSLEKLSLAFNNITRLEVGMFKWLDGVEELDLRWNDIVDVEKGVWKDTDRIKTLHIHVRILKKDMLADLKYLEGLDIGYCHLSFVENGAFRELLAVKWINLEDNDLTTLSELAFHPSGFQQYFQSRRRRPSWRARNEEEEEDHMRLALSNNPLQCNSSLCWLKQAERDLSITWPYKLTPKNTKWYQYPECVVNQRGSLSDTLWTQTMESTCPVV